MINATINIHTSSLTGLYRWVWALRRKRRRIAIPTHWSEVPYRQRIKAIAALMQRGEVSDDAVRILLFKALTGLPQWIIDRIRPLTFTEDLLPHTDWAQTLPAERWEHTIQIGKNTWCIPEEGMKDMMLQQFFTLEQIVSNLLTGADVLDFLAALLRPANEATQHHHEEYGMLPPASKVLRKQYARQLIKIAPEHSFYLLQYYAAQRDSLKHDFPALYAKGQDDKKTEPTDWDSLPAKIAESGVFGPLPAVLRTPARVYLAWANARVAEQNKETQQSLQDIIRAHHKKFTA